MSRSCFRTWNLTHWLHSCGLTFFLPNQNTSDLQSVLVYKNKTSLEGPSRRETLTGHRMYKLIYTNLPSITLWPKTKGLVIYLSSPPIRLCLTLGGFPPRPGSSSLISFVLPSTKHTSWTLLFCLFVFFLPCSHFLFVCMCKHLWMFEGQLERVRSFNGR